MTTSSGGSPRTVEVGFEPPGAVGEGPIQAEARNTSTIALAVMSLVIVAFMVFALLWHFVFVRPVRFAGWAGEAWRRYIRAPGFPT